MLLMSLYVVTILMLTLMIIVQGHTCDYLTGTHVGEYAVVIWEILEQTKTLASTSSMIILTGNFLTRRVDRIDLDLYFMVLI